MDCMVQSKKLYQHERVMDGKMVQVRELGNVNLGHVCKKDIMNEKLECTRTENKIENCNKCAQTWVSEVNTVDCVDHNVTSDARKSIVTALLISVKGKLKQHRR